MIFLLTTFGNIEQHLAQGINLVFFVPTSIVTIIVNFKNKNIRLKSAIIVSLAGIIGAIIGAKISVGIDVKKLRKFFGVFLIIMAFFEIISLIKSYIKYKKRL